MANDIDAAAKAVGLVVAVMLQSYEKFFKGIVV